MANASALNPKGDEFPILCESCLGPNPYVRMMKEPWDSACKVCERPFTSFRWRPAGLGTRPKKTEVCQTCARAKNVCQTCLLDLEYGLPVQVRDLSMAAGDRQRTVVPKSDGTREYAAAQAERAIATGDIDAIYNAPKVNSIAERAKRKEPKYERNRARICSFFLKGTCTRGLYCPYRHEKPEGDDEEAMADQNLRDRYYGVNDPVAQKILRKSGVSTEGKPIPSARRNNTEVPPVPEDLTIQTLFIGGITASVSDDDLRKLLKGYGHLSRLSVMPNKGIGFAEFTSRDDAESAMRALHGPNNINGARVFINWGRGNRKRPRPQPLTEDTRGEVFHQIGKQSAPISGDGGNEGRVPIVESQSEKRPKVVTASPNPVLKENKIERVVDSGTAKPRLPTVAKLSSFPKVSDAYLLNKSALPPAQRYAAQDPSKLSEVEHRGAVRGVER